MDNLIHHSPIATFGDRWLARKSRWAAPTNRRSCSASNHSCSPPGEKKRPSHSSSFSHSTPNWSTSDIPELIETLETPIYSLHIHYISSRIQPNGLRWAVNASLGSLSLPAPQSCSSDLQFYLTIFVSLSTPLTKALELPPSKLPEGALQRPQRTAGAFVVTKKKKFSLDSSPPLRFSYLLHTIPPPFDLSP